ncbi:superfamily II DNA helicase RecQ [Thalassobacillus devorans]|uniref:RQC-minor-1 family DNA-binding protein n=1 Tax=Thalassobacillus devorans TaxID=279813 RepID=UPI000AEB94FD|nr:RQC-minor-1 family DNA-binding protein [Thalassobacillus devorans]NIK30046.1 superfamily II DNA helicase RecQ [Thalassobacillus devorans]
MKKSNNNHLSEEEKRAILRAADEIIAAGGRTLLAKILKGSREKKVLQLELDKCPVYGYFKSEKLEEVQNKIDWMFDYDFLDIQYSGNLPMIVFTERGWQIERDQRADEFLREWQQWAEQGISQPDMSYLKDRNREMILLFLEKVKETQDKRYIPYLKTWAEIDYKKVKAKIQEIIKALASNEPIDHQLKLKREESMKEMLKGEAPQDLLLKCYECGERFLFTVGEQKFYKQKGFVYPKRCNECRNQRDEEEFLW